MTPTIEIFSYLIADIDQFYCQPIYLFIKRIKCFSQLMCKVKYYITRLQRTIKPDNFKVHSVTASVTKQFSIVLSNPRFNDVGSQLFLYLQ